ncbi:MAG: COX15/CtaA family protein [Verrucomicrobia bacterium]|nr:COX15/CtaA family protein [Verrucomicrobiota bacterium]
MNPEPWSHPVPPKAGKPDNLSSCWLHRFVLFTAIVTLPLIFVGGLVTSHDAALAVPDWPTTWGYNMFFFPWSKMVGGIFYEHSHRLLASLVGLFTVILTAWIVMRDDRRWMRRLGGLALALVIAQGILGGLRVILLHKSIAIVHACLAQGFFCLLAAIAMFTSPWWRRSEGLAPSRDTASLRGWTAWTALLIFGQLALGAAMRHTESGLAVPDFPAIYGHWRLPLSASALDEINQTRIWRWDLEPVSLNQIGIHLAHRLGAGLVALAVFGVLARAWRHHRHNRTIFYPAVSLAILVALQIGLGAFVIWSGKAADIATAHVAMGALILACSVLLTLVTFKRLTSKRLPLKNGAVSSLAVGVGAVSSPATSTKAFT